MLNRVLSGLQVTHLHTQKQPTFLPHGCTMKGGNDAGSGSPRRELQLLPDDGLLPQRDCHEHPKEGQRSGPQQQLAWRELEGAIGRVVFWGHDGEGWDDAHKACIG